MTECMDFIFRDEMNCLYWGRSILFGSQPGSEVGVLELWLCRFQWFVLELLTSC